MRVNEKEEVHTGSGINWEDSSRQETLRNSILAHIERTMGYPTILDEPFTNDELRRMGYDIDLTLAYRFSEQFGLEAYQQLEDELVKVKIREMEQQISDATTNAPDLFNPSVVESLLQKANEGFGRLGLEIISVDSSLTADNRQVALADVAGVRPILSVGENSYAVRRRIGTAVAIAGIAASTVVASPAEAAAPPEFGPVPTTNTTVSESFVPQNDTEQTKTAAEPSTNEEPTSIASVVEVVETPTTIEAETEEPISTELEGTMEVIDTKYGPQTIFVPKPPKTSPIQAEVEKLFDKSEGEFTEKALDVISDEPELEDIHLEYQGPTNYGPGVTGISKEIDKIIANGTFGDVATDADPKGLADKVKIDAEQLEGIINLKMQLDYITTGDQVMIDEAYALFDDKFESMDEDFRNEVAELISDDSDFFTDDAKNWPYQQKIAYIIKLYEVNATIYVTKQVAAETIEAKHKAKDRNTEKSTKDKGVNTKAIGKHFGKFDQLSSVKKRFAAEVTAGVIALHKKGYKFNEEAVIAQAFLESGYGQSDLARKYNNIFGIKAGDSWKGKTVSLPTIEYYDGVRTEVMAKWRVYDSVEDSIKDRIKWLNNMSYYKDAVRCSDNTGDFIDGMLARLDKECEVAGKEPMYATDPSYKSKLLSIIDDLNIREVIKDANKVPHSTKPNVKLEKEKGSQYPKRSVDGTPFVGQKDNRWAGTSYNRPNGDRKTIAESGCVPSTMSFTTEYLDLDDLTPEDWAEINQEHGFRNNTGTDTRRAFQFLAKKYGLNYREIPSNASKQNIKLMRDAVKGGNGIVVAAGSDASIYDPAPFTTAGHTLAIYDVSKKGGSKTNDSNNYDNSGIWWPKNQLLDRASTLIIITK